MQRKIQAIIKDISLRNNVPFEVVKEIVYAQYELAGKTIRAANTEDAKTYKNILFNFLGKVAVKPFRLRYHDGIQGTDRYNYPEGFTDRGWADNSEQGS